MMKKIYQAFVNVEEYLTCLMLAALTALMFLSALMRKFGMPLNWAGDVSLLFFAWACFFGCDLSIRDKNLVNVDMLLCKFPAKVQKVIRIACQLAAMVLLALLVVYGTPLCIESVARKMSNMELSYSWVTASVPVGALLMEITSAVNLVKMFRSEDGNYSVDEGGSDIC